MRDANSQLFVEKSATQSWDGNSFPILVKVIGKVIRKSHRFLDIEKEQYEIFKV
jgi:hypothetical protein